MSIFRREASKDFIDRLSKAQNVRFSVKDVFDAKTYDLVSSHSSSLGCAKQLILFPLLAAVASCMGTHTTVKINSEWQEQIILWLLVAARSGEKKTPALNKLKEAVKGIETEIHVLMTAQTCEQDIPVSEKRLLIDNSNIFALAESAEQGLSTEKVFSHLVMLDNFGALLANEGNIPSCFISSSLTDLYEGSDMAIGNNKSVVFQSHINFVAMMKGRDIVALLDTDDADGFLDRTLLACPCSIQEGFSIDTYGSNTGKNIPSLQTLLSSVRNFHKVQEVTYTFSPDGEEHFKRCLQKLQVISNAMLDDERCRGSVNKAPGQIARLAAILTAMQNGLLMATEGGLSQRLPPKVINKSVVESAYVLVKYSLDQKFSIYGKSVLEPELTTEDDVQIVEEPESTWKDGSESERTMSGSTSNTERKMAFHISHGVAQKKLRTKMASCDELLRNGLGFLQYSVANGSGNVANNCIRRSFNREQSTRYTPVSTVQCQSSQHNLFDSGLFESPCAEQMNVANSDQLDAGVSSDDFHRQQNIPVLDNTTCSFQEQVNIDHHGHIENRVRPEALNPLQHRQYRLEQPTPNQIFVNQAHGGWDERLGENVIRDRLPDVYEFDDETFIGYCAAKIKKLLLTRGSMVTAAFACQYRLFPPVPRSQRRASMKTTHPVWAAGKFFERVEKLGLAIVISRRGMSIRLRKKRLEDIGEAGKVVFSKISLLPEEYERSYPKTMGVSQISSSNGHILTNTDSSFPFSQSSDDIYGAGFSLGVAPMQTSLDFSCKVENP